VALRGRVPGGVASLGEPAPPAWLDSSVHSESGAWRSVVGRRGIHRSNHAVEHCVWYRKRGGVKVEREVQDRLHADVCAGDPTAWSRVFTALLDWLVDWLGFRWSDLRDSERLHDFAVDSIMSYLRAPHRYDPAQSSLLSYLRMDAHGDLLNEHDRLQRAGEAERQVCVEVGDLERKGIPDEYPSDREPPTMTLAQIREVFPDERDRRAVLLLIADERSTEAFAEVWDLADLPPDERFAVVKRNKDRVKARIRRLRKSA
jgi:hypothetical protein